MRRPRQEGPPSTTRSSPSVVLVLGAPRSGTTALHRQLCLHPETSWISGLQRRVPHLTALGRLNRLARDRPDTQVRVWFPDGNAYPYGRDRPLAERLFPAPVEGEPVLRFLGVPPPGGPDAISTEPRQADLVRARRRLHALLRHGGGRALVLKRIADNRRIGWWAKACPDVRFVVVTRDGRDVATSLLAVDWWADEWLWWAGCSVSDWTATGRDPRVAAARHWAEEVAAIDRGLAGLAAPAVHRLRYEDLRVDPVAELRAAAAFAGLDPDDPRWLAQLGHVAAASRHRTPRSGDDRGIDAVVTEVAGTTLHALGYR